MTSAGGERGGGGGEGGGTYCLRRRAWGALRRRGGTCSRAGLRRWCSSRGRCRGGRQTWRGTQRSGRGRGRRAQRCGRGGGTWRVRWGRCASPTNVASRSSLLSPRIIPGYYLLPRLLIAGCSRVAWISR